MREFRFGHDVPETLEGEKGQVKSAVGRRKHVPEQFVRIKENIGPEAFVPFVRPCRVRNVAGHTGDVTRLKAEGLTVEFHRSAPGVADADLQTVVEMQPGTGDI